MKLHYHVITALLVLAIAGAWAQGGPPGGGPGPHGAAAGPHGMGPHGPGMTSMADSLFLPEQIMQHQTELNLSTNQEAAIKSEMQNTQARLLDLQWQLQSETGKVSDLVKPDHVDEAALVAQLDKVLALEDAVKKAHFTVLVRIKNILTPAQQAKLRELRPKLESRQPGQPPAAPANPHHPQGAPPQPPPQE